MTVDDLSDAKTLTDEEWPVDERYLVDSVQTPHPGGELGDPAETTVRQRGPIAALAVVVLALLLVALLAALLATRQEPGKATPLSAGPPSSSAGVQDRTTTTSTAPAAAATTSVPGVVGLQWAEARSRLERAGLRARSRRVASHAPTDEVLEQQPDAGSTTRSNALVLLVVSGGARRVSLPEVTGAMANAASRKLRTLGLHPRIRLVRSTRASGTVLDQSPGADTRVAVGSVVRLDVARHVPAVVRIEVPSVVGLTAVAARRRLSAAGLDVAVVQLTSSQPAQTVVRQLPRAGARVRRGTTVSIGVSTGPAQVAVPSVVGLDEQSARGELEAVGFVVSVVDAPTNDPIEDGMVTAQDPGGDSDAPSGSTVTLTVGRLG